MKTYLFVVIFLLFSFSCKKIQNNEKVDDSNAEVIHVSDKWFFTAQDSLFSDVRFLPLETTTECYISYVWDVKFKDSLIFINENRRRLLVFNDKGKFKYEIGRTGKGPGEHINVRDFFITDENTVELLDYTRINIFFINREIFVYKEV